MAERWLHIAAGCLALLLSGCVANNSDVHTSNAAASMQNHSTSKAFKFATVGVADMDVALALWRDEFGFDVVYESVGPDASLDALWELNDTTITRQVLLSGSSSNEAKLHLVEFSNPKPPVREGAALYDDLPKNIDIYTNKIEESVGPLKRAGYAFRSEKPQEFMSNGILVKELHMPGPDETNIVIIERDDVTFPVNENGYYGVGLIIATVDDVDVEHAFLENLLNLETANAVELSGPELEKVTGLPPGTRWLIRILGDKDRFEGQIELVEYRGVESKNRYDRAVPGALGLIELTYEVADMQPIIQSLKSQKHAYTIHNRITLLEQCYDVIRLRSPAGMPLQIISMAGSC